jgi:hypothetical protein
VRTSKLRSQQEQAAATRLLALEGFDANKYATLLTAEGNM